MKDLIHINTPIRRRRKIMNGMEFVTYGRNENGKKEKKEEEENEVREGGEIKEEEEEEE